MSLWFLFAKSLVVLHAVGAAGFGCLCDTADENEGAGAHGVMQVVGPVW